MSSYTVAGSADMEDTGTCETIANEIKKFYKNIDFRIIIKHPKEWEEYIHEICRTYGFKKKVNPIVFTLDGKLIGGIDQFKEMAENKFGINPSSLVSSITTKINMTQVEKEVAAKKKIRKGKRTLQEKIQDSLKQKYENETLHPVKGIFQSDINEGLQFYVKREEKLCPPVIINPEQIFEVKKQIIVEENIDLALIAANDNYPPEVVVVEEDIDKSVSQEGQAKLQGNSQIGTTPRDSKSFATPRALQKELGKTKIEQGKQSSQILQEEQSNVGSQPNLQTDQRLNSQQSNRNHDIQLTEEEEALKLNELNNSHLNENEHQKVNKDALIERSLAPTSEIVPEIFDLSPFIIKTIKKSDYYLAFHPFPLFDGQAILFEKYPHLEAQQDPPLPHSEDHHQEGEQEENQEQLEQSIPNEVPLDKVSELKNKNEELLRNQETILIVDYSKTERERKNRENGNKYKEQYQAQQKRLEEQGGKEILVLDNHSLQESTEKEQEIQARKSQEDLIEHQEELLPPPPSYPYKGRGNRECVDLAKPLAKSDWRIICKVMKKLSCIVTLQILPHGYHSHLPLTAGIVNLFLRKFMIGVHTNQSILSKLTDQTNDQDPLLTLLPLEQVILNEQSKAVKVGKYYNIPSFEFPHALVFFKKDKKIKKKKLASKFKKIIHSITPNEEDSLRMGFNLVITQQFMLVVPLYKPYSSFNGQPLFLHPLAYLGFVHLPKLTLKWPTTAFEEKDLTSSLERLRIQAIAV